MVRTILATLARAGVRCDHSHDTDGVTVRAVHIRTAPLDASRAERTARALTVALAQAGHTTGSVTVEPWHEGIRVMVPKRQRIYPRTARLWGRCAPAGLRVPLGVRWDNAPLVLDLGADDTCHAYVGGRPGSGKSWLMATIAAGLAAGNRPAGLRLVLVDPKGSTFGGPLARLAHLEYGVATTVEHANAALAAVVRHMRLRVDHGQTTPPWVVMVDEADWPGLDQGAMAHIANYGRGLGIHLVCATRTLGKNTLPRDVYANLGGRICGLVAPGDHYASKFALDDAQLACRLLGAGDMYANLAGTSASGTDGPLIRFQAAGASPDDPLWRAPGWTKITLEDPVPSAPQVATAVHARSPASAVADDEVLADMSAGRVRPSVRALRQRGFGTGRATRLVKRWQGVTVTGSKGVSGAGAAGPETHPTPVTVTVTREG